MMRFISVCFVVIFSFAFPSFLSARESLLLNFGWLYHQGVVNGAQDERFNDKDWTKVNLPHDASIYGDFVQGEGKPATWYGFRPRHKGWYRRSITIHGSKLFYDDQATATEIAGKRLLLHFEGVYRLANVYVNGHHSYGPQLNGYLDFECDITDFLHEGRNVIAVSYDNTDSRTSRWYSGEGINRNVWLIVTDPVRVARYGTSVTTNGNDVNMVTEVLNQYSDSVMCQLVTSIISPKGQAVATDTAVAPISPGETFCFHNKLNVYKPMLWDVGKGVLYKAVSKIYVDGHEMDAYSTPFAFRTVEFSPKNGFLLNGHKVFLRGVCLHTDLAPLGTASFDAGWNRRLSVLVDSLGCNAIRLSHNCYPQYVLDWCDRHGVLVLDEFTDKWDQSLYGEENVYGPHLFTDLKEQIRRDRNHPSVFLWSVGNEVYEQYQRDSLMHGGVEKLKELVAEARLTDPSRAVTVCLYPCRKDAMKWSENGYYQSAPHQFAFYTDVMSVNYMEGFFKRDHQRYPQLSFLVSEIATGELGYSFFGYDHSYVCGQFYWGGTDYLGESFGWPSKGWINGLITLTNDLKPIGQSVRSFYSDRPMVSLAVADDAKRETREWNDAKITWKPFRTEWNYRKGDTLNVQVFSNCDSTELILNGRSLGIKTLPPKTRKPELVWKVGYEPGELCAVGYNNGKKVAGNRLRTVGKVDRLEIIPDIKTLKANGLDLCYIKLCLVDKHGNIVQDADRKVMVDVSGAGVNAGMASGDIMSSERFQTNTHSTWRGCCQLIVRSLRTQGDIIVKVKAPGLQNKSIKLLSR